MTKPGQTETSTHRFRRVVLAAAVATLLPAAASMAAPATTPRQESFASPQAAVDALVAAARADKTAELVRILGPHGRKLVYSGDRVADDAARDRFVAAYDKEHKVDAADGTKASLVIGDEEWPFPIPLVQRGGNWRFDTAAGEQEILYRRIGRNELNAIQVARAYVDAQRDYASKDRDDDRVLEYAQKFVSSPGKHDGLYWSDEAAGESPMGPLMASARAEGYGVRHGPNRGEPYHGYYYRILRRQGAGAPGGAYDYIANGHMIGGFAMVAFPAAYGTSGVMSFIVNQDGTVYEKNLGHNTAAVARGMQSFDPDTSWKAIEEK